jgi:bleomycin hydrolase
MKKIFLLLSLFFVLSPSFAQNKEKKDTTGYKFTDIIRLPATSVKDQYASGTCWAFSTVSFLESEMARNGMNIKDVPDISEMYVVKKVYEQKAKKYVRMHGTIEFGGGGSFYDVIWTLKNYGMVPENVYPGLNYGTKKHNHAELDKVLKAYVDVLVKENKLTTAWFRGFDGILEAYLGKEPKSFQYKGKTYTPKSFAQQVIKLNPDDYVSITSYTHHPFYKPFALEVQDNWQWSKSYNVPMNEMVQIVDYALKHGYTVAWGADVSEPYFSYHNGIAVVPDLPMKDLVVTERSRWEKTNPKKYHLDKPGKEKTITQKMRQQAFDNYSTTDDHGMHIVGLAKDQNGTQYYIVKNSWNTNNPYKGYLYVSKAYFEYKTMNFLLNKNAIPKNIRKKLGL